MSEGAPAFTVRAARPEDLWRIAWLEEASFANPWSYELLSDEIGHPRSLLLVAAREAGPATGPAIGYIAFRNGAGEAELLRLAVDPGERRQGIARELVDAGLALLRQEGAAACFLEVRTDNAGAIAFYRTLGFAETGRRRGYYRDGTDALVMARGV